MRGRGRGRGRGGSGPQSVSQQFLLRSAQEAGFDVRNLRALSSTSAGAIFPDLQWHSNGGSRRSGGGDSGPLVEDVNEPLSSEGVRVKQEDPATGDTTATSHRTPQMVFLISKSREMHHRFQNSVFYVRSSKEVPDVVRYSDRLLPPPNIDAGAVLSHCLGGRKRTCAGVFVPEELCGGQRRIGIGYSQKGNGKDTNKNLRGLNLEELAAKIQNDGPDNANEEEEKQEGEEDYYEEEGEESDGEDYVQNYYESEGDESRGSDKEPTF